MSRFLTWIPPVVAVILLAGVVALGQRVGWKLPKASALLGAPQKVPDDWCVEHAVPESICVECGGVKPSPLEWCKRHGVNECALCNPNKAQTAAPPTVTEDDRQAADRALAFKARTENSKKCKLPERRIQLASSDLVAKLGVTTEKVGRGEISEWVEAPAELAYDPSQVARVFARADGVVVEVFASIGGRVKKGDVLAIVDAVEVGKAKAEMLQAVVDEELRRKTLAVLRNSEGAIAGGRILEAEATLEEAVVRTLLARQSLANLGLPIDDLRDATTAQLQEKLRSLGIPVELSFMRAVAGSNNLLAVRSPFDGEIVTRAAVGGEAAEAGKPLFVVANSSRLWISLAVGSEHANKVRVNQKVFFSHDGHESKDAAAVTWVSPVADERTRSVQVRAELDNAGRTCRVGEFGVGRVVLREEKKAIVVPSEAVHWEGDCHVVFIRDRNFEKDDQSRVFHVRQVRPGAKDVLAGRNVTEIAGGIAPGEWVAVANSGLFRSELLKNNLGAG
jgi:membrane fusion protein, heavy metal efflux system